jgi:iron complex outermembrane receptor protein
MHRRGPPMRLGGVLAALLASRSAAAQAPAGASSPPSPPDAAPAPICETIVPGPDLDQGTSIRTVERDEIDRSGATSAAQVLERQPAIHATTGTRGERIFTLRGFDQRQTAVLVDGAPAYIPYDGQVDLAMVPAEILERITIVEGPASILYGPNGLGGAINLVTRRPGAGPLLEARTEGGPYGALRLAGRASGTAGPVGMQVFGGVDRRDGWPLSASFRPTPVENGGVRENSDLDLGHVGGGVRVHAADGQDVEASALFLDGARGVPPGLHDNPPRWWRFTSWEALSAMAGHRGTWSDRVETDETAYVRLYRNVLDGYDDANYATQDSPSAMHSIYRDGTFGGRARLRARLDPTPWGPTVVRVWAGAQHDVHDEDPGPGQPRATYAQTLVTLAPEIQASLPHRLDLTLACQVDVEIPKDFPSGAPGSRVEPGPLASLAWEPVDGLELRVTGARRSRFPTLRERFSTALGYQVPNPDLRPESAWHAAVDASWSPARWASLRVGGWDAEVADLIDQVALGAGKERMENVASARIAGVEGGATVHPLRWLGLEAGYVFLHAVRTDTGADLPYRPAHRAVATVVATPWRWLEASTTVVVVGASLYTDPNTLRPGSLAPYATWDLRVAVRPVAAVEFWAQVLNLLDSNHQTEYGFPDPGREFRIGARLSFYRPAASGSGP